MPSPKDIPDLETRLMNARVMRQAERTGRRVTGETSTGVKAYAEPTSGGTTWGTSQRGFGFNILRRKRS